MVGEILDTAALAEAGVPIPAITLNYGYYRQPNGWITGSAVTMLERVQYEQEGWEHLPNYGRFEMANPYAANHPLEQLFMMGGAHELPVAQVIESGLALNPPLIPACKTLLTQFHKRHNADCMVGAQPVEFPQLEGVDVNYDGFKCNFCTDVRPTMEANDQHEGVAHKDEKANIRTGEVLGDKIAEGLGRALGNGATAAPEAAPVDVKDARSVVMDVLKGMKLNKAQRKALLAKGIEIPEDADGTS